MRRPVLIALSFVLAAAAGAGGALAYLSYVLDAIDQAEARSLEAVDG